MPAEAGIKCGAWTSEEDKRLRELQSKLGNRWSAVAAQLPGRTGQQCAQRWRHKVNPYIRKDKWTPEEDALLAELYAKYGNRWAEIARRCNGRTDQQCMGRWRRHLDPAIKREQWEAEEDAGLRRLVREHGSQWSRIAKELTGRTAQQCRARWFQIQACNDRTSSSSKSDSDRSHNDRKSSASNSSGSGCTVVPPTPGIGGGNSATESKSPASVLNARELTTPTGGDSSPGGVMDEISQLSDELDHLDRACGAPGVEGEEHGGDDTAEMLWVIPDVPAKDEEEEGGYDDGMGVSMESSGARIRRRSAMRSRAGRGSPLTCRRPAGLSAIEPPAGPLLPDMFGRIPTPDASGCLDVLLDVEGSDHLVLHDGGGPSTSGQGTGGGSSHHGGSSSFPFPSERVWKTSPTGGGVPSTLPSPNDSSSPTGLTPTGLPNIGVPFGSLQSPTDIPGALLSPDSLADSFSSGGLATPDWPFSSAASKRRRSELSPTSSAGGGDTPAAGSEAKRARVGAGGGSDVEGDHDHHLLNLDTPRGGDVAAAVGAFEFAANPATVAGS